MKPQHAARGTKSVPAGPVNPWLGQKTKLVPIVLCPACARCQRRALPFVLRVILATIASVVLFRLVWLWLCS